MTWQSRVLCDEDGIATLRFATFAMTSSVMKRKVGIILVGYKDYVNRFLIECRDSLRIQNYPKDSYQIYIVDNCSINNCEYIKKHYPEAKTATRSDGNYSAANNLGLKMAMEDNCDYFIIANMDTKFDQNWIIELVRAMESDPKIGIAQSKILLYPKTEKEQKLAKINSLGNIMHFLGFGFTNDYNEPDREIRGLPEIIGYASGCSYITKREVIEKIGYYDEEYYMYHDDVEMNWKVKLAGYKIILAPKSIVYHKYEFSRSVLMIYYMERNRHLAMLHYYKLPTLILVMPAVLGMDLGMFFYSIAGGWTKKYFQVIKYFLLPKTWACIILKRRKIRKIKDKDIIKNFEGRVLFQEIENPVLKYIANPIFNLYWQIVKRIIIW